MAAEGMTNHEMAQTLFVTLHTVQLAIAPSRHAMSCPAAFATCH
jgi:hypothetical protein